MKKLSVVIVAVLILTLVSCNKKQNDTDTTTEYMKESVDEFLSVLGYVQDEKTSSEYALIKEKCFNVTPDQIEEETEIKIFKFSDSCESYVFIDGEVFELCESFGGYGYINAVPCDFDANGDIDLLVASSWGSGIHRSIISVFNTTSKEPTVIYDGMDSGTPFIDLVVETKTASGSDETTTSFQIYSAEINVDSGNFAKLSYVAKDLIGTVEAPNGIPEFKEIDE